MLAPALLLATAIAAPAPLTLLPGVHHYFGADGFTNAQYLHLQPEGRYRIVDVEHMFTMVEDVGRWHLERGRVVLESDDNVRFIRAGDFTVYLYKRCDGGALPQLRAAVRKLRARNAPVPRGEVDELHFDAGTTPARGSAARSCRATLGYGNHVSEAPVSPGELDALLAAIDAWLAQSATQNVFEYGTWEYRGERFLVPLRPGMQAVQQGVDEVRAAMDRAEGGPAPFVFYEIPAAEHDRRANCTYGFKFHPEMNQPCNRP